MTLSDTLATFANAAATLLANAVKYQAKKIKSFLALCHEIMGDSPEPVTMDMLSRVKGQEPHELRLAIEAAYEKISLCCS